MKKTGVRLLPWLLLMSPGLAGAQTGASSSEWEFALTPFLWAAGMEGTVGLGGRDVDFEASAEDVLETLDFGFMTNFEARKGPWSIGADVFFVDLGKEVTVDRLPVAPQLDMSMTILEGDVGYEVAPSLDVLAGVRGVSASAELEVDDRELRESDGGFVDPIVGARYQRYLTEKLWIQLRGDVGGFGVGSDFSWFAGAAGGFRLTQLISLDFGYRTWGFDYESDEDLKRLDLTLAGFGAGLTLHF